MPICKNCGHEFDLKFCSNCGQKASVKRIDFKTITNDLPNAILNIDRGFLFNVIELSKRPGYAIKDYLEGKRKSFYHPLSYLFIMTAAMLVAMTILKVHYYDPVQDSWMSAKQSAFWKEYDETQQTWIHYYQFFIPFYLPWMSLIFFLWLRVLKQPYNYWECVVISFFVSAQMNLPQIFALILAYLINSTAFTRTSDIVINDVTIFLLFSFQFYQLGSEVIKRKRRIVFSVFGAIILFAFVYLSIYSFLSLVRN